ncbi:hypothetical protein BJ170DRAFT_607548 [Xylariales sp. AK1849]|nr:hypothetical protein BJ170DRAFT_607548 [Xylariales sp. AK1849]
MGPTLGLALLLGFLRIFLRLYGRGLNHQVFLAIGYRGVRRYLRLRQGPVLKFMGSNSPLIFLHFCFPIEVWNRIKIHEVM